MAQSRDPRVRASRGPNAEENTMIPGWRRLHPVIALAFVAALAACSSAPIGKAANLKGTYYENALVTNPNGGGPQVIRWGPPSNWNAADNN
jgi:hypothetical protein